MKLYLNRHEHVLARADISRMGRSDGSEYGVGHGQPLHRIEARSLAHRAPGSRGIILPRSFRICSECISYCPALIITAHRF